MPSRPGFRRAQDLSGRRLLYLLPGTSEGCTAGRTLEEARFRLERHRGRTQAACLVPQTTQRTPRGDGFSHHRPKLKKHSKCNL